MQKISSGISSLDNLIDSFYIGDNVIWEVSPGTAYEVFVNHFIKQSLNDAQKIIYISFNHSPQHILKKIEDFCYKENPSIFSYLTLIDCFTSGKGKNDNTFLKFYKRQSNINVIRVENPANINEFTKIINSIEDSFQVGSRYIFDSLTGMQDLWEDENKTYKFFTYMCPRLYDLETVAYWILEKDAHSQKFKANIRHVTQVVFNLYERKERMYIKALKLAERVSREAFKPHPYEINGNDITISVPKKELSINIGNKLKELRTALGMSQKDIADKTDLTPSFISQVENNQISPSLSSFIQICNVLGINPGEIIDFRKTDDSILIFKKESILSNPISERDAIRIYNIFTEKNFSAQVVIFLQGSTLDRYFFHQDNKYFIYLIRGKILLRIDGRDEMLNQGDSLYLKKSMPSQLANKGDTEAELLVICLKISPCKEL